MQRADAGKNDDFFFNLINSPISIEDQILFLFSFSPHPRNQFDKFTTLDSRFIFLFFPFSLRIFSFSSLLFSSLLFIYSFAVVEIVVDAAVIIIIIIAVDPREQCGMRLYVCKTKRMHAHSHLYLHIHVFSLSLSPSQFYSGRNKPRRSCSVCVSVCVVLGERGNFNKRKMQSIRLGEKRQVIKSKTKEKRTNIRFNQRDCSRLLDHWEGIEWMGDGGRRGKKIVQIRFARWRTPTSLFCVDKRANFFSRSAYRSYGSSKILPWRYQKENTRRRHFPPTVVSTSSFIESAFFRTFPASLLRKW